jgi:hypothetical protein
MLMLAGGGDIDLELLKYGAGRRPVMGVIRVICSPTPTAEEGCRYAGSGQPSRR